MKFPAPRSVKGRLGLVFICLALSVILFVWIWIELLPSGSLTSRFDINLSWESWLALGVGGIGLLFMGGYLISRSSLRHLDRIGKLLQKMEPQAMSQQPVRQTDPVEIQNIIHSFNLLIQNVETRLEEMRNFVAISNHELRTPLTAIKLRVEALREGALDDPEVAGRFLEEVELEIDRLSKMVSDQLDLTRIEAGMSYSPAIRLDFAQIVQEVCAAFVVRANGAGIELKWALDEDLPKVTGIEEQLRRVVYNLVDNAIKYTSNGGRVSVHLASMDRRAGLRLAVKDSGYGISPAELPHVFERFYRVEATRPHYATSRGSGLGLAIAKTIVERHTGKIRANSEIGRGSEFIVELPAAQ